MSSTPANAQQSAPAAASSSGSSSGSSGGQSGGPLQQDFESFYHSVCSDLQNRGEVHSMSKLFATLTSDEERMRFVLERNFGGGGGTSGMTSWGSWRDFNFAHKDRAESQKLRNLGNQVRGHRYLGLLSILTFVGLFQVYQKNKLSEALEYYSQSICLAPHPPPPNSYLLHSGGMMGGGLMGQGGGDGNMGGDDGAFTHEELALGFANRSAVLFQVSKVLFPIPLAFHK